MIGNILGRAAKQAGGKLNILSFVCHEPYEEVLAKTGHNFFDYHDKDTRSWNYECRPLPSNISLVSPGSIPSDINFDLILSHNKFGHIQKAKQFQQRFGIPIISLEHTLPHPNWGDANIEQLKNLRGEYNVFISEYSRDQWLWSDDECDVIPHGIESDVFCPDDNIPKQKYILSTVNDWKNRDWCCNYKLWEEVTKGLPVRVRGNNPGLSTGTKTREELIHEFRSAQVFLSTAKISPVPMSLLEAMSTGCASVSSATCMIPEFMKNKQNGYLTNDPKLMREYLIELLDDPEKAKRIGQAGRDSITSLFSLTSFINNWNNLFVRAIY